MANSKSTSSKSRRSAASTKSAGKATKPRSKSRTSAAKQRSNPTEASQADTSQNGQATSTVKQVAAKAKGPAVAVGAAAATAAGVAGGLLLKSRMQRKKVLGVPLPRSLGKNHLDPKSIAKTVGKASNSFAKTSKTVSHDLERAGDQAERIGKILG